MKRSALVLALAAALPAAAQSAPQGPKVTGLVQVWYTQMLDNNLRINSAGSPYYNLRGEFKENGFNVRRTEIKVSGSVMDGVDYELMIDPSINTSATNPTILQDAVITYKPGAGFEFKLGQMKTFQTWEGTISSSELIFAERGQLDRVFGDTRDRGAAAIWNFGSPKEFGGRIVLGAFNGMSSVNAGKGGDVNAQKDIVARLDFNVGAAHKFGFYTLQGSTDQADKGALKADTFAGANAPSAAEVLDNRDKTSNLGAYYVFQANGLHLSAEVITGLLGRRFPSVIAGTAVAASRQHLDQKFQGAVLTGAYTAGHHTVGLRFDTLNYNSGDDWYTTTNPYTTNAQGAPTGNDFTPKFTEITAGYTYGFQPEKLKAANIKVNYIHRSKNFLAPRAGQTGEQGGDTLMAAFQIAF